MLILLKMCLNTSKPLLACSCAALALIFISISKLDGEINIVNGNGRGSDINDFTNLSKSVKTMGNSDYFLNHLNGDMYQYRNNCERWDCTANCGFHS